MKLVRAADGTLVTRPDYSKTILLTRDHFNHDGHLTQSLTIPPHTKQRHHRHHIQSEVIFVVHGECDAIVNKTNYQLTAGDNLMIEPEDVHCFENNGYEPCHMFVLKIHYPDDSEDTEWLS